MDNHTLVFLCSEIPFMSFSVLALKLGCESRRRPTALYPATKASPSVVGTKSEPLGDKHEVAETAKPVLPHNFA
jgi:hypothetical protein